MGRDERLVFEIPKLISQQNGYLFSQYNKPTLIHGLQHLACRDGNEATPFSILFSFGCRLISPLV